MEEEKLRFVAEYLKGEESMTALCGRFGVSRESGYETVRRYRTAGPAGLAPRSRAPHRHARRMPDDVAAAILALRRERPYWGPKKLRVVLQRRAPETSWPAASTIGDLLKRAGLVRQRRRQRRPEPVTQPFLPVEAANDLWCIDFKGWFRTQDGRRCDPLTISDAHSRFLIDCAIVRPNGEASAPVIDRALREFGLPRAIRTDNGAPFASRSAGGLSPLSVHWAKLGIRLERIDPGAPQQNARHERMHGALAREAADPPAADVAAQQRELDRFRRDYNEERPHEALDFAVPASLYRPSRRLYPERIEPPAYDADHDVRLVRSNGEFKWKGEAIYVGEVLASEPVGIAETERGHWLVRFAAVELGLIDRDSGRFIRFAPARPGRRKTEQTKETVTHVSGLFCP